MNDHAPVGTIAPEPPRPLTETPSMAKAKDPNDRVQIRRTPEFDAMVADLARRWGGIVKALSVSEVVREAVKRAHAAEFPGPAKKTSKKSR